ncbi:tetratricopeptide repeat protein [Corallococcus aberystwythensis]|uniref:CHAT domain-containing protein n=1 Tax=Corallococcus aberystwythensis TaxID=2316722 RepID=A0A3A8R1C0_9BACT|nr:CHAT domain-containing protein [Corallococcus aberystwythensis]RKH73000.1 CHAT domain-containing protein [Corallococcus aberystwythensis]
MVKPAKKSLWALALAIPLLAGGVAALKPRAQPPSVPDTFWTDRRAAARIEARLTHPEADRYRSRAPAGGCPVPAEPMPLGPLARMEAQEDWGGIAAAYALEGEWNQAAPFLERTPASPERDSDLAAVALARGDHERALRLLDGALAAKPGLTQALWNRALVFREMGLTLRASELFEQVAKRNEQGWGREAHAQALTLREATLERQRQWKAARDATLALVADPRAPLPMDAARQMPGTVRGVFYDVVRTAASKERAQALLPLAKELDRLHGGSVLTDYVQRVAKRDFSRRGALAQQYADSLRAGHGIPDALLDKARLSGDDDIYLGALLRTRGNATRDLQDTLTRIQRTNDPWFMAVAERDQARKEVSEGAWWKAEQRYFGALQRCRETTLSVRCLELERRLAMFYGDMQRVSEAEQHARQLWAGARQLREWDLELNALEILSHVARSRNDLGSARAYLEEWMVRGASISCAWPHVQLAHLLYQDLRPEAARRELDLAAACTDNPMDPMFGATLAELTRTNSGPQDAAWMQAISANMGAGPVIARSDRVYSRYLEGRFLLDQDRARGESLLRDTIAQADALPRGDALAREAWALGYSSLATDAGRAGEFPKVVALMAAQLGTPVPTRCALAASVHAERTVLVALGPKGEVKGHYDASRKVAFAHADSSRMVPEALRQTLASCERVDVLAWAPVFGRTDLLPSELAWSFRLGRVSGPRPAPSATRRLVVAGVETPSLLQLPRLPAWTPDAEPGGAPPDVLSGSDATPSRVLARMADATEIEIHAHGITDPTLSGASLVVLSPEVNGRYALTADVVREHRLTGAPTVFLAACSAGRTTALQSTEPFSLPAAFIDSGARAVLASTVDIPDAAGRFFDGVRRRIHAGTPAAIALRDERQAWLSRDSRAGWTRFVLLVENAE